MTGLWRSFGALAITLWLALPLAPLGCGADPEETSVGATPLVRPGQGVTLAQGEILLGASVVQLRERFGGALVERDLGPAGLWFELPTEGVAGHASGEQGARLVDGLELVAPCEARTEDGVGVGSAESELREAHPELGTEPFLGMLRGAGVAYELGDGGVRRVLVFP